MGELLSFSANATGTSFTGGPITILAADAVLSNFSFDVGSLALSFNASNAGGFAPFNPGYGEVFCDPCAVGANLSVRLDNLGSSRTSTRVIAAVSVTQNNVPEPASWLLVATAVAFAGSACVRRRRGCGA